MNEQDIKIVDVAGNEVYFNIKSYLKQECFSKAIFIN